jgi:prepilin-type N-terminal cleavage/methylation domain-containing protein
LDLVEIGKMKTLKDGQRGFTLIEMVIALGIAALITGVITYAIMQTLTVDHRASNHMVAVRQVQQAGDQVSKDALQAQGVNVTPSDGLLALTWQEWGTSQNNTVTYSIAENGELRRTQSVNGGNSTVTTVAEYIDDDPNLTRCDLNGTVLTFRVTATVGTESATRTYKIEPRPTSPPDS